MNTQPGVTPFADEQVVVGVLTIESKEKVNPIITKTHAIALFVRSATMFSSDIEPGT